MFIVISIEDTDGYRNMIKKNQWVRKKEEDADNFTGEMYWMRSSGRRRKLNLDTDATRKEEKQYKFIDQNINPKCSYRMKLVERYKTNWNIHYLFTLLLLYNLK